MTIGPDETLAEAIRLLAEHRIGALVIFVSYLATLYGPINSMFQTYGLALGSRAAVQRVFDVLDTERDVQDNRREIPAKSARGEVAWEDVSFGYVPGHPVLSGVSLHVRPGQKVAIVGATGAGKSTLLSLLPRFYDPWAGRVLVDGVDTREYQLHSLRRQRFGIVRRHASFSRPWCSARLSTTTSRSAGRTPATTTSWRPPGWPASTR